MASRTLIIAFTALLLSVCAMAAEKPPHISELSFIDQHYMTEQQASLNELARISLGRQFKGVKQSDLELLQALLDRNLVQASQKKELQAMGVVMGNLMADELNMHWVIYEDAVGRSRALRYKKTDNYLFPMTMISRRREVGNLSSVEHIYQRAIDIIKPQLPTLPFQ